jgi:hypothetical protein
MPQREDSQPNSDPAVAAEEEKAKAENKAAFVRLANCLTASRDLGYVRCEKADVWPNGLQLGLNDNPSDLFLDIADIKAQ